MFAIKSFIIQPKLLECEYNSIAYLFTFSSWLLVILKVDPVTKQLYPKTANMVLLHRIQNYSSLMISYPAEGNLNVKGEEISLRQVYAMLHAILIS